MDSNNFFLKILLVNSRRVDCRKKIDKIKFNFIMLFQQQIRRAKTYINYKNY